MSAEFNGALKLLVAEARYCFTRQNPEHVFAVSLPPSSLSLLGTVVGGSGSSGHGSRGVSD